MQVGFIGMAQSVKCKSCQHYHVPIPISASTTQYVHMLIVQLFQQHVTVIMRIIMIIQPERAVRLT